MGINVIMKNLILRFIPKYIKNVIEEPYKNILNSRNFSFKNSEEEHKHLNFSFSQEGEDLILHRLIGTKTNGFYIDIGAHHPKRFSNTYKFYKMGWRGINIDPLPGTMKVFNEKRPEDINLEIAISNNEKEVSKYYMFNEPALNTFNEDHANHIQKNNSEYHLIKTSDIQTCKLSRVLNKYLKDGQNIDFMNIDVEGWELSVIESNDWDKYCPHYLIIESFGTKLEDDLNSEMTMKLKSYGYSLISKTVNSLIFKNEKDLL